jgi:hypothetical protein
VTSAIVGRRGSPAERASRHRWAAAAVLAILLVVGGWLGWQVVMAAFVEDQPVTLPQTFLGHERATGVHDFGADENWRKSARDAAGGAGFAGAAYGNPRATMINVTAARTDLTGELDLRLAGDSGEEYTAVRCTRYLNFSTKDQPAPARLNERMLLCWRTSPTLSVIAFAVTRPPTADELAPAVQSLWDTIRAQDP